MIEVQNLSKSYGDLLAVDRVSFDVRPGEVVGFLGPNGAGKSTTLRMLTGFLTPSSGTARIAGHDVVEEPLSAQRLLGYMPETCPLYPELRVEEYLAFRARLKHVRRRETTEAVERAMEFAGIAERRGSLIGQLSRGLKQRVGLADALVASPPLLVLDEPTAGMDPNQIREVRSLIRKLKQEHTVLLSTHILAEVEMVCDRAVVLNAGRIVGQGTLDALKRAREQNEAEIVLELDGFERDAVSAEFEPFGKCSIQETGDALHVRIALVEAEHGLSSLIERLVERGHRVREARLLHTRLEDVFATLTETSAEPHDG